MQPNNIAKHEEACARAAAAAAAHAKLVAEGKAQPPRTWTLAQRAALDRRREAAIAAAVAQRVYFVQRREELALAALAERNKRHDAARRVVAAASATASELAWDSVEALRVVAATARKSTMEAARRRDNCVYQAAESTRILQHYRRLLLECEQRLAEQTASVLQQDRVVAKSESAAGAARAEFLRADAAAAERGGGAEAAHSRRGELFVDVLSIVAGVGFAAEVSRCRQLCGTTWRAGVRRADGSLDTAGFAGGTNDMMVRSLRLQVNWADAARRERRQYHMGTDKTTSLIRAIHLNNLVGMLRLVQLGAPLGATDSIGRNAVHHAANAGWTSGNSLLEKLLDFRWRNEGDVVNKRSSVGLSPLCETAKWGGVRHIRALIRHGAHIGVEGAGSWDRTTALHEAVRCSMTRLLSQSPFAGVSYGLECLKLLVVAPGAAGAMSCADREGLTPHALALKLGKLEAAALLQVA